MNVIVQCKMLASMIDSDGYQNYPYVVLQYIVSNSEKGYGTLLKETGRRRERLREREGEKGEGGETEQEKQTDR